MNVRLTRVVDASGLVLRLSHEHLPPQVGVEVWKRVLKRLVHGGRCGLERRLTLPSRGRPTSGFASCRPPLMSNVRRQPMRYRCLFLTFLAASGVAIAQTTTTLYKSTGPDGKTIYSDRPPSIAKEAKTLTFQNGP